MRFCLALLCSGVDMVQFTSQQAEKRASMFVSTMKALRSLESLIMEVKRTHEALTEATKAIDFAQQVIVEKNAEIKRLQEQMKGNLK